ncbi:MAG: hypothetical protein Q8P41_23235 [Pseudomonadota bacterium]|nr:hypothetical protein [Pseudomonadota bacterium]
MIRSRTATRTAIAFASLWTLLGTAHAACRNFAVDDSFAITQENGYRVTFKLTQDETGAFTGTASYPSGSEEVTGTARGAIGDRGKFDLVVNWENGSVGDYTGWVTRDGNISDGTAFDRAHPESRTTWTNVHPLRCAD